MAKDTELSFTQLFEQLNEFETQLNMLLVRLVKLEVKLNNLLYSLEDDGK